MRRVLLFVVTLILSSFQAQAQPIPRTFKVMAWNIFHGANDIPNGRENAIEIIKEINPDVILMIETYGSGKMIADALDYNFHLIAPQGTDLENKNINLSIISRYPFGDRIDTGHPFYLGGREVLINNQKIRFFTNWFHYLPWHDEPEKMGKSVEELLLWEKSGTKYKMIQKVLPYLNKYAAETDSIPMILGGDLNTLSHLDWSEENKERHNGLVVPWYSTKLLENMGLIDTYRSLNASAIDNPGITWHTKGKNDAHRIDYVFYKSPKLKAIKSETFKAYFNEPFFINNKEIVYPSDHGIVVTTFEFLD